MIREGDNIIVIPLIDFETSWWDASGLLKIDTGAELGDR